MKIAGCFSNRSNQFFTNVKGNATRITGFGVLFCERKSIYAYSFMKAGAG